MKRLSDAITAGAANLLSKHLPGRTKRLIFLASFSARLKGATVFDNATLAKLNEAMVLCSSDSAIKLPVQLSKAIWQGKTIYDITDEHIGSEAVGCDRLECIVNRVLSAMPSWLRYDDDKIIKGDVARLFDQRGQVFGI